MGDNTGIEWTDATWNPIVGCSVVSPGCTNCYAMKMAGRWRVKSESIYWGLTKKTHGGAVWNGQMAFNEKTLVAPLHWKRPRRIFVNSMGDLFHENVPDWWIDKVFAVMTLAPQHTYQILTKRAARMRTYIESKMTNAPEWVHLSSEGGNVLLPYEGGLPTFIWLGVSAEDQTRYDERKENLRATPAVIRFMSLEPLLGPIKGDWFGDWAIVGAESGPRARPMHNDWARSILDQCHGYGTSFFMKQLSGTNGHAIKDIALFPDGLRIRQSPPLRK